MVAACLQAVGAVGEKAPELALNVAVKLINQLEIERKGTLSAEFVRAQEQVVSALKRGPKPRNEIYCLLRPRLRHLSRPGGEAISVADLINAALRDLAESGYVISQHKRTGGRRLEVWALTPSTGTAVRDREIRRSRQPAPAIA